MYAIVEIAGLQYKVAKNQRVFVHRLEANEGTRVEFDKVLLVEKDGKVTVGTPVIDGARVAAKILSHLKGDKVIVFKKKRRKGYQKWNGHRQQLTELWITGVLGKGEQLDAADAKAEVDSVLKLKAASHNGSLKKRRFTKDSDDNIILAENVAAEPAEEVKKPAKKRAPAKKAEGTAKKPAAKKSTKKKED